MLVELFFRFHASNISNRCCTWQAPNPPQPYFPAARAQPYFQLFSFFHFFAAKVSQLWRSRARTGVGVGYLVDSSSSKAHSCGREHPVARRTSPGSLRYKHYEVVVAFFPSSDGTATILALPGSFQKEMQTTVFSNLLLMLSYPLTLVVLKVGVNFVH